MATAQATSSLDADHHHKRAKSSVLKSFIHKRTLSRGTVLSSAANENAVSNSPAGLALPGQFLPIDHPHNRALSELQHNQQNQCPQSPTKSRDAGLPKTAGDDDKSLNKKTKSSISLKSLAGKDSEKHSKTTSESPKKPKKIKSSTNLVSLLSRPRSSKNLRNAAAKEDTCTEKDKENYTPSSQSSADSSLQPPIYAQFSTQHFTTQPYGGKFLEDEIDLYTPQEYSPGKQRNFYEGPGSQPTLGGNNGPRRPMSTFIPSSYSIKDIHRQLSGASRRSAEQPRRVSFETRPSLDRKVSHQEPKVDLTMAKRGSRMMAAVAALGTKTKTTELKASTELDIKDVDVEFEAMLDRRNIPENQRHKMRSLALSMKKDFIRQDWAEIAAAQAIRPTSNECNGNADDALQQLDNTKIKRPRSRTFTLSKSSKEPNSSSKKSKPEDTIGAHSRTKSWDSTAGYGKSLTSSGAAVASTLIAKAKGQLPDDFVAYLRKFQKPELVEVGKLHKLRLLLRNETVAWTDEFISLGGMNEIVGLLHRTLAVEWREEHEDALLHEVLLCLKALCTTALALQYLNDIQSTLFPTIIHMLFDEEKKGPSEFTTRNIVTSLLFTYLKSAPLPDRPHRAQVLLSYLRDPEPKEEERPVGFVLEMRRDRPYRVWCKEVVNVTKEVFWIFLHNLNVIPLPSPPTSTSDISSEEVSEAGISSISAAVANGASFDAFNRHHYYMMKHFPQERPPVPAAPYVGGVEWDATNYLSSQLDLLNGLISSLPTPSSRNSLREQLRVSGWERCMGATLRLCKEKFYGGVHDGLRCWVTAAHEDEWAVGDVRFGPVVEVKSPKKSPPKKKVEEAPRLEMPKLDFGFEKSEEKEEEGGWI